MLVDASLQGGVDWVLAHSTFINSEDIIPLFEAQRRLILLSEQIRQAADPDAELVAHESEIAQINRILLRGLQSHTLPPTAVGSGENLANRAHKLQCLLHSLRLEVGSLSELQQHNAGIVSLTTDFGVESSLSDARANQRLDAVLPGFCDPPESQVKARHLWDSSVAVDEQNLAEGYYMPWSLQICGVLHILHNACKDMLSALEHYGAWFAPLFYPTCAFLNNRGSRDRLVESCFSQPPASWSARKYRALAHH